MNIQTNLLKLINVFYKIASSPPILDYPKEHVYNLVLEKSIIPKRWKDRFKAILNIRIKVLSAISHDAKRPEKKHNINEFKNLKRTQQPLIKVTRKLIDDVREIILSDEYNWEKYYEDLYKLEAYEFFMGENLYFEVSDWVNQVHGIISYMFKILENHYKKEWKVFEKTPTKEEEKDLNIPESKTDPTILDLF